MLFSELIESLQVVRLTLSRTGYVPHREVRFPYGIIWELLTRAMSKITLLPFLWEITSPRVDILWYIINWIKAFLYSGKDGRN